MKRTNFVPAAALSVALATTLACQAEKSETPLSPSVAGPIPGVEISPPQMIEPAQGSRYKENQQPIRLSVGNATSNGVRPLYYTFEVAADSAFQTKMFARSQVQPGDGQTSVTIDRLELGHTYYWRARAEDGANTGPFSTVQFEVLPRAQLGAPPLLSPINNQRTGSRRPELVVGRAERNAAVGAVGYEFYIALDAAFSQLVAVGGVGETGDTTSFTPDANLAADRQHFWKVRASDNETTSEWSGVQAFVTAGASSPPPPGPAPGGPCNSSSAEAIVACERGKGHVQLHARRGPVAQSQRDSRRPVRHPAKAKRDQLQRLLV